MLLDRSYSWEKIASWEEDCNRNQNHHLHLLLLHPFLFIKYHVFLIIFNLLLLPILIFCVFIIWWSCYSSHDDDPERRWGTRKWMIRREWKAEEESRRKASQKLPSFAALLFKEKDLKSKRLYQQPVDQVKHILILNTGHHHLTLEDHFLDITTSVVIEGTRTSTGVASHVNNRRPSFFSFLRPPLSSRLLQEVPAKTCRR